MRSRGRGGGGGHISFFLDKSSCLTLSGSWRICLSKALADMDMADYSEALDPAYTTLEFENMQVLTMGTGECVISSPGAVNFETYRDFKTLVRRGQRVFGC